VQHAVGSGHEILEQLEFEMIIIDELRRPSSSARLIPLRYRCARCVMVGGKEVSWDEHPR